MPPCQPLLPTYRHFSFFVCILLTIASAQSWNSRLACGKCGGSGCAFNNGSCVPAEPRSPCPPPTFPCACLKCSTCALPCAFGNGTCAPTVGEGIDGRSCPYGSSLCVNVQRCESRTLSNIDTLSALEQRDKAGTSFSRISAIFRWRLQMFALDETLAMI